MTATSTGSWPGPAARIAIGSSPRQPVLALLDRPAAVRRDADARRLPLDRGRLRVGGSAVRRSSRRIVRGRRRPVSARELQGWPPHTRPMTHPRSSTPRSARSWPRRVRATLATTAPDGRPRLVPICFVLAPEDDAVGRPLLYMPLDEKPKRDADPHNLARVRDLLVLPQATLLVDRWDEDWTQLGWVRLYGAGEVLEPEPREVEEHAAAVAALRAKYPQYASQAIDARPVLRFAIDRIVAWGDARRRRAGLAGPASTSSRNVRSVWVNHVGRSRLGMWATSGRSMRRAFGARVHEHRAPSRWSPARRAAPTIASTGTAQLAEPPGRRRVEHDRVAVLELLRRRSRGHPPHELPRRLRRRARPAARPRRPRSARRGRPSPPSPSPPPAPRSRSNAASASGVLSTSAPETPPQTQTRPETRSGYSSAVSSDDRPAREQPTSTARSSPAASITAIRSARFENGTCSTSVRPNPRRS